MREAWLIPGRAATTAAELRWRAGEKCWPWRPARWTCRRRALRQASCAVEVEGLRAGELDDSWTRVDPEEWAAVGRLAPGAGGIDPGEHEFLFEEDWHDEPLIPPVPGHYLWLERKLGRLSAWVPPLEQTAGVLYVGWTSNLGNRLFRFCNEDAARSRECPVLHALFDRVLVHDLTDQQLREVVGNRWMYSLCSLWIRSRVVFAFRPYHGPGPKKLASQLALALDAQFNALGGWTHHERLGPTRFPGSPYEAIPYARSD
jgi:hypothetical protein